MQPAAQTSNSGFTLGSPRLGGALDSQGARCWPLVGMRAASPVVVHQSPRGPRMRTSHLPMSAHPGALIASLAIVLFCGCATLTANEGAETPTAAFKRDTASRSEPQPASTDRSSITEPKRGGAEAKHEGDERKNGAAKPKMAPAAREVAESYPGSELVGAVVGGTALGIGGLVIGSKFTSFYAEFNWPPYVGLFIGASFGAQLLGDSMGGDGSFASTLMGGFLGGGLGLVLAHAGAGLGYLTLSLPVLGAIIGYEGSSIDRCSHASESRTVSPSIAPTRSGAVLGFSARF